MLSWKDLCLEMVLISRELAGHHHVELCNIERASGHPGEAVRFAGIAHG